MLDALFDGDAWSVRALARAARVSESTASEHLDMLRKGGLVVASRDGRQRRYRLASEEVAHALECLGALAPPLPPRGLTESSRNEALRLGRTCYDHLAGRLGVAVTEELSAEVTCTARPTALLPPARARARSPRSRSTSRS